MFSLLQKVASSVCAMDHPADDHITNKLKLLGGQTKRRIGLVTWTGHFGLIIHALIGYEGMGIFEAGYHGIISMTEVILPQKSPMCAAYRWGGSW